MFLRSLGPRSMGHRLARQTSRRRGRPGPGLPRLAAGVRKLRGRLWRREDLNPPEPERHTYIPLYIYIYVIYMDILYVCTCMYVQVRTYRYVFTCMYVQVCVNMYMYVLINLQGLCFNSSSNSHFRRGFSVASSRLLKGLCKGFVSSFARLFKVC